MQSRNFIHSEIEDFLGQAATDKKVATRFPPEPNGYLHIGHARAICLNFDIAHTYQSPCYLRFDDSNPGKESMEYVHSIMEDIQWLGYEWSGQPKYASDYFEQMYEYAVTLIKEEKAYVDELSADQIRDYRGTLTQPGENSPYRDRPTEENLDLFEKMRQGNFSEGQYVLRARIDMASPNLNMRDPIIYRIRDIAHYRTGNQWSIYPMYDFIHSLSDALEGITHSLCTLEFEDHRPLYDWFLQNLPVPCHPRQIEFARLNLSHTITSKRLLMQLVESDLVTGWDDPRMPTLRGMRRRGFPPAALRNFCECIGLTKKNALVDAAALEECVRQELNETSERAMGVLQPLRLIIDNHPETEREFTVPRHPQDPDRGNRILPFSRELYIDKDDFSLEPPAGFHRLAPGREVRLRHACLVTCRNVVRDENSGEVIEIHCDYDPNSLGGKAADNRRVKSTLHWVSARHAVPAKIHLYDRLFTTPEPARNNTEWMQTYNADSWHTVNGFLEPDLSTMTETHQLERLGYFRPDSKESKPGNLVLNRVLPLRDTWAKQQKKQGKAA